MSEEQAKDPAPAPPEPLAPPKGVGKYHFLVVGDEIDDHGPQWFTANSLKEMLPELHEALTRCRAGWCYVIVDGQRWVLSSPKQFFELQKPDGKVVRVEPGAKASFSQDGRFTALVESTRHD